MLTLIGNIPKKYFFKISLYIFSTIIFSYLVLNIHLLNMNKINNQLIPITEITRSPSDRFAFSARPWNYLIPDIDHPVFGDLAVRVNFWIWQHPPYYLTEPFFPKEHTLFLGYTLIALSIYTI